MYINTEYETEVQIQYGQLKQMIDWCTTNCSDKWGYTILNEAGEEPGYYSFKFESSKDYVTFLIWKK